MRAQRSEAAARPGDIGVGLARGVCRGLYHLGYTCLTEFKLTSRRRVDVIGLDAGGVVVIVEVKSSLEDFRADRKWPEYLAYCDYFYFAVPVEFPRAVLPEDCGLLVADFYGAALAREAPLLKLNANRRRVQTLRFAQTAAQRLTRFTDPDPTARHSLGPDRGLDPDLDVDFGLGTNAGPRLF